MLLRSVVDVLDPVEDYLGLLELGSVKNGFSEKVCDLSCDRRFLYYQLVIN